jgi:hypothetical protein
VISAGADFQPASERDRYRMLVDIGRVLTATLSPVALFETVHKQCARLVEMHAFFISVYDPDDDVATIAYRSGTPDLPASYAGSASRSLRDGRPQLQHRGETLTPHAALYSRGTPYSGAP